MYQSFIINHIYRKSYNNCYCKICNYEFPINVHNIVHHLATIESHQRHFQQLQFDQELQYLPENLSYVLFDNGIIYDGNSKYICYTCNSAIFGLRSVESHIKGYLHGKILESKVKFVYIFFF